MIKEKVLTFSDEYQFEKERKKKNYEMKRAKPKGKNGIEGKFSNKKTKFNKNFDYDEEEYEY